MKHLPTWLNLSTITAVAGVAVLILMVLQMSGVSDQARVNSQLLKNQETVLVQLKKGNDARDGAVQYLITDNAQQTVILCKLILSNGSHFSDQDIASIETICKEKIAQANNPAVPSTSSPSPTQTNNPPKTNVLVVPPKTTSPSPSSLNTPPTDTPSAAPGTVRTLLDGFTSGTKQILNSVKKVL